MAFFGSGTQQKSVFGGSGFGGISPASSSAFGQPAAGGFGGSAFGAQTASAFGSTFGQSSAALGGGLFGSPQPQPQQGGLFGGAAGGGFGSFSQPTSAFGAAPATPGFGGAQPQQQPNAMPQPPAAVHPQLGYATNGQGSRVAPFQPENTKQQDQAVQQFRTISAMPVYIDKSPEELRLEDYSNNCKGAPGAQPYPTIHPSKTAATGTQGFGSPGAGGFGAGTSTFGTFGASASAFGASASAFGAPAQGGSLFGQPASQPSLFGAQPAGQTSLFGNTSPGFGGSTFGQPASQPAAFGFSQPAQASPFGTPAASSASLFGGQQASPFGQKPATTSLFGAPAQSAPSLFGAPASSQSLFGAPAASSASLFNQPGAAAPFGTPIKPAGFGATAASPFGQQPAQPAGGLFGAASSASLFGAPASSPLFGQPSSASLFGAPASGGLFGNTGAGAFGQKPATPGGGGLFGNTGSSLFGAQSSASLFGTGAALGAGGGGLFGAPASSASLFGAASSPSLFGAPAQPAGAAPFGSMFGQPAGGAVVQASPPVAPAAAGQSPYGALPAVPALPDMKSGIAASPVNRSVKVPPPVVFRPHRRPTTPLRSPLRSPKTSPAPGTNDTQRHLASRSPSIFKISYRDPGLVINGPLPSTAARSSPPAAAEGHGISSPASSPSTAAPAGPTSAMREQLVTPEIQPIGAVRASSRQPGASSLPSQRDTASASPPPLQGFHSLEAAEEQPAAPRKDVRIPEVPEGWYMKPSPEDLRAKVGRDPESIKAVDRFTVGKNGVGKIMFLEDVDLSEVKNLGDVFAIQTGHVAAYKEGVVPKPPFGQGCNQPARIQINFPMKRLNKVVKREECKSTEEHISRIKLALQRMNTEADSTFVSCQVLDSTNVVWTFEVPHWSRYGLPPELCDSASDDSETEADMGIVLRRPTTARPRAGPADAVAADFTAVPADSYKIDSEDNASDGTDMHEVESQPITPTPQPHTVFQPLQPLYERSSVAAAPLSSPMSAEQALATPPSAHAPTPESQRAQTAWGAPARPLQLQRPSSADAPSDVSMLAQRETVHDAADTTCMPQCDGSVVTDMWPLMSRSRRAHISPQGRIAAASHKLVGTQMHSSVKLSKLLPGSVLMSEPAPEGGAACRGLQDVLRQRAQRLLEVHSQYSSSAWASSDTAVVAGSPGSAGMDVDTAVATVEDPGTELRPHLVFSCQSDTMPCEAMKDACSHERWLQGDSGLHTTVAEHAPALGEHSRALGATFALIRRLFGALGPADGSQDADSEAVTALLVAQRKLELSEWLEEQVDREVADALPKAEQSTGGAQAVVMELLSAHDIPTAVRVATGAGLPRLSCLIAGAGLAPRSSALLAHQIAAPGGLPSWTTFGLFQDPQSRLMPPPLEAAYKLLSGDIAAALGFLLARKVTWQRVFAMCLWYGILPDQPLAAALLGFSHMLSTVPLHSGVPVPFPGPWYEDVALRAHPKQRPQQVLDAQYVLLHLAAREPLTLTSVRSSLALRLASTGAYSPDPLDSLVPWLVCGILRAVGTLADDCGGDRTLSDVYAQLTLDCAATLVWLGETRWAVYVLCHLPALDEESVQAKAELLQHVLDIHRGVRVSLDSAEADKEWLAGTCRIPSHLIARADALAAQAHFRTNARAEALATAEQEDSAHAFMLQAAGPQHLSRKQSPELGAWLLTCPTLKNQDAVAIREFLHLRARIEARADTGQGEVVCSHGEREAAYTVLLHACTRLSELQALGAGSEEQQAMFTHMAAMLGKWLLAGQRGSVSITDQAGPRSVLRHIPCSALSFHEVVGRA